MLEQNPYESPHQESYESRYEREKRMWAMFIHLSVLAGLFVVPIAGWILPIVLWQIKKDDIPELDIHGRIVVNWLLSSLIYTAICIPLALSIIGIPLVPVVILAVFVMNIIFSVIGGIKANNGEVWHYPMSFQFV